jgi:hypothetical protein
VSSRTTASFRKALAALPEQVQDRAREAFRLFSENPAHPSLQFKQVHPTEPIFSARVTLDYWALARRRDDHWIWFWIGSHSDYDQLLERL